VTDATEGEKDGIWFALRRRKVVQWGIAYAAGAWGLLQGLEYVSSTFDWPRQIQQLATLALLIGLPIVLVLAWYHGDRGERRVTRTELAILTLLFLLGGGLFWRYQHMGAASESPLPAACDYVNDVCYRFDRPFHCRTLAERIRTRSIVLRGRHLEELLTCSQIPELRVIARTSSFLFKGGGGCAQVRRLNVSTARRRVRRSGDTLRITAQLVRLRQLAPMVADLRPADD
jgi:hypothetical protein